jgi:CO/xanthine dehydrogenase Mo-binding subunit
MPVNLAIPNMKIPPHPIIAAGAVHDGEPVAAVVAESTAQAWDA